MTHKNLCSGCGYNFGTLETFEKHRIFDVPEDWDTRRCMTVEEMHAAGWEYSEPLMTFYTNGRPYKKATPTWTLPIALSRAKNLYQREHTE